MPPFTTRSARGFTLTEVLVASAIFVTLGLGLVIILKKSIDTWQIRETSRDAGMRALNVLEMVCNDLEALVTDMGREPAWQAQNPGRIRLRIGVDAIGNPYIIGVRYLDNEVGTTILRQAGQLSEAQGSSNPLTPSARPWGLDAPAGMAEFAYRFGPTPRWRVTLTNGDTFEVEETTTDDGTRLYLSAEGLLDIPQTMMVGSPEFLGFGLYRGFQAPIGQPQGTRSSGLGPLFGDFPVTGEDITSIPEYERLLRPAFDRKYQLAAEGILYVGVQMWVPPNPRVPGDYGNWAPDPRLPPDPPDPGPKVFFDTFGRNLMPTALLVTVTAQPLVGVPAEAMLLTPSLAPDATSMTLTSVKGVPDPTSGDAWMLIGSPETGFEWVAYTGLAGNTVTGLVRQCRGTVTPEQPFPAGTPVRWGLTVSRRVDLTQNAAPPTP